MKFYLVPIGEQFSFQGLTYTKAGPLTASAEIDGKSKMIPRSANVELLNSTEPALPATDKAKLVLSDDVLTAVNSCHLECLEHLAAVQSEVTEDVYEDVKQKINASHNKLINNIKLLH